MPSLTFRFPFAPALLLSALCLALVASLPTHAAPAKLIEKITAPTAPAAAASPAAAAQIVIPYAKYVLPNGLTLVVHEDRSDPVVHIDVTYHVGSAREEIGKSGFAHFFEHMMFQGSDHVGDDQHFKIVTAAGGTLNGSTNRDRTNYYQTVPSNQLEKMLWLEADRMGFLLDAVTQKKFEVQRGTVKNERGQNYDNRPYGLAREVTAQALYPYGHPYSWLTIGYVEDLNRVTVDDLKNFFLRWYGPNNATLTIGGDVDTAAAVALVEKYFGPIPRGPAVTPTKLPPPVLDRDRHITLVDNYARLPQLSITVPSVPENHPDEPALDCLAQILGQGKNSVLYQQLTRTQKALGASAFNSTAELSGEFIFSVTPAPGTSLAATKKLVDEALASFDTRGVTDEDIAKFTGSIEAQLINGLQSVSGKVRSLAAWQTYTGTPNRIGVELRRYTSVTKADVRRVYEKYLKGKPAVILSIALKSDPANVVAPADYTPDASAYRAPDYGYAGLKYTKATDTFDRSTLPGNGPNPVVKVPPFWRTTLPSGVDVIGAASRELPTVALTLSLPGGQLGLAATPAKAGLAQLYAAMMNEDTQDRSAEQMQLVLQTLGSSVSVDSDFDDIQFNVQTLKKNLDKTLPLLEERLLRPKFTAAAFDRLKRQMLEGFKSRKAQPALVATEVFAKINHGPTSILGVSPAGTEETVKNLTLADVEAYHARFLTARGAKLVVVGDITREEIVGRLGFLAKLPARDVQLPAVPAAPALAKTRLYIVDVPKAAQTEFRVGYVTGLTYDATGDYYRAGLMNYILGGAFNSRLNLNLREDKAWTYGARSGFTGSKYSGSFTFSSGIRVDATGGALTEVLQELNAYAQKGITAEELAFTQSALGQRDALLYETPLQKAGFIRRIMDYNLPGDFVDAQNKILATMQKSEIDRVAAKWIKTDALNILLVGDKSKILPAIAHFGYEVIELTADGQPVVPR